MVVVGVVVVVVVSSEPQGAWKLGWPPLRDCHGYRFLYRALPVYSPGSGGVQSQVGWVGEARYATLVLDAHYWQHKLPCGPKPLKYNSHSAPKILTYQIAETVQHVHHV